MKGTIFSAVLALLASVALPPAASASTITLRGSHASMVRQNAVARANDFTFARTPGEIEHLAQLGKLVRMPGDADYRTAGVSYPYTRPTTATFIERLAVQYRAACGQPLVVTSLTRPLDEQPRNASPLSVHPTGMAVDLRVPADASCRAWLEGALLGFERKGVLDVTREHRPPHLHVALFPEKYRAYAAPMIAADSARAAAGERQQATPPRRVPPVAPASVAAAGPVTGRGLARWAPVALLLALAAVVLRRRLGQG